MRWSGQKTQRGSNVIQSRGHGLNEGQRNANYWKI